MTTIAQSLSGALLKISAALPATYNAAGYQALSWTTVNEITDLGTGLGKKYDLITHQPVADRKKYKLRGGYDNGTLQLKMARSTLNATDPGQTLLIAAAASDTAYSYQIQFQDGGQIYFTALNMGFLTEMGTVNNILGAAVELQLNEDIIETT